MKLIAVVVFFPLLVFQAWAEDVPSPTTLNSAAPRLRIKLFGVDKVSDCKTQLAELQEELKNLKYPADWTVAVTCTPNYWEDALRSFGYPRTNSAFTLLHAKVTVLNGEIFKELQPVYRRVIAHELGHILCGCDEEATADKIAWDLEKKLPPNTPNEEPHTTVIVTDATR